MVLGFYNTPTVIGQIKGGKLKAIAVTSKQRSELLPDVPTMIEQGVKGYVVNTWFGFAVPKGVPQAPCGERGGHSPEEYAHRTAATCMMVALAS